MNKLITLISLLAFFLVGCNNTENSKIYEGEPLKIGIIGEEPLVKENITFVPLNIEELSNEGFNKNLDAIFINEEHLMEASKAKYADIYLTSPIPFIFINSEKSYIAFTDKSVDYENAYPNKGNYYLQGYLDKINFGVKLKDNKINDANIQEAYSLIFPMIAEKKFDSIDTTN